MLHHVVDDVLQHLLGHVHLALEVAERHLGLDHPELGRVTAGVGVLRAERGAKGVDVAKAHGEVLCLELAGDGEVGLLAEEVLAVVDLAVLGERRVGRVDRGDAEHLAGTLGVGRGDDGRVDVDEAALLEEAVDGERRDAAHAEHRAEQVGAAAQVLLGAQELAGLALLLHGVVRLRRALDHDGLGLELERLRAVRRERELAGDDEGGANGEGRDLLVVGELLSVHDDLQVLEAAAVVQHDEAEVLHVANRADPAGHGDRLVPKLVHVRIELRDPGAVHLRDPPLVQGRAFGRGPGSSRPARPCRGPALGPWRACCPTT